MKNSANQSSIMVTNKEIVVAPTCLHIWGPTYCTYLDWRSQLQCCRTIVVVITKDENNPKVNNPIAVGFCMKSSHSC
jgi:N6-adenosine-specific RNA methylase IME4